MSALKRVIEKEGIEKEGLELEIIANNKTLEDGQSVLQVLNLSVYENLLLNISSLKRQQDLLSSTSRTHTESMFLVHGFCPSRIALIFCL